MIMSLVTTKMKIYGQLRYVDIKTDVESAINRCNELLKNDVCKKAVVLIDKDLFEEHPNVKYENIEFLPVSSDLDVESVKSLIV